MFDSQLPDKIKVGQFYTTTWANNKKLKWQLIDVTNNVAYLKTRNPDKPIETHVNLLRKPNV